jgi:sigma-B regulation protein RsbU (phosphoserine phosphatase)
MAKHVLIVDDEPHLRFAVAIALRKEGYMVSEAENGESAFEMILTRHRLASQYDLLILDIQMPAMSGIELIDELRKHDITIPVFAVSGFGDKALLLELLRRGCSEFLDKPFMPEEIIRRTRSILQKT